MSLSDHKDKLNRVIDNLSLWEKSFPFFKPDETLDIDEKAFDDCMLEFSERMKDNYPFHHPLYAGQMLKPPHPVAMIGYIAAMMINPNNHALDAGPATARMEKELIEIWARKSGFGKHLGHLTSSGTIANFEALLIAREIHPSKAVVFCDQAHYTHRRVCHWLGIEALEIGSTPSGKMDISHLERTLCSHEVGTVVVTLGSTSLGALDELDRVLELKKRHDFRIHVDGAYGGYFGIIARYSRSLEVFDLIAQCDSLVFDPHKQGLQPYGCGCIIFSDPDVGRFYRHDSPYTYFTSDELHLGEISVECSRAGAAAAALWLTTMLLPLESDRGMGPILKKTIDASMDMAAALMSSTHYRLYIKPETTIVTYFPEAGSTAEISCLSDSIMTRGMRSRENQLFLATLRIDSTHFAANHPDIRIDSADVTILRSCLMKPEHKAWVSEIMERLERLYGEH
jgi:glutamate/tyrosine decarboxylase-like PLP-dependent enzyme